MKKLYNNKKCNQQNNMSEAVWIFNSKLRWSSREAAEKMYWVGRGYDPATKIAWWEVSYKGIKGNSTVFLQTIKTLPKQHFREANY